MYGRNELIARYDMLLFPVGDAPCWNIYGFHRQFLLRIGLGRIFSSNFSKFSLLCTVLLCIVFFCLSQLVLSMVEGKLNRLGRIFPGKLD